MFESMSLKTKALLVSVPILLIIKGIGCFEAQKLIDQDSNCPISSFVAMLEKNRLVWIRPLNRALTIKGLDVPFLPFASTVSAVQSISTVSAVINKRGYVRDRLRARIENALREAVLKRLRNPHQPETERVLLQTQLTVRESTAAPNGMLHGHP
jgi:hypothetical protein